MMGFLQGLQLMVYLKELGHKPLHAAPSLLENGWGGPISRFMLKFSEEELR